jgi:hypothetical protein
MYEIAWIPYLECDRDYSACHWAMLEWRLRCCRQYSIVAGAFLLMLRRFAGWRRSPELLSGEQDDLEVSGKLA